MSGCLLLALSLSLSQGPRAAAAQDALELLDYPKAVELTRALLASGTAGADETWRAHAIAGQAEAAMGHEKRAADAFARALSLHPGWAPPPDASPRLLGPFNQAKARLKGRRLTAAVEQRCLSGRAEVSVRADSDVESLVHGARLRVRSGEGGFDTVATARTQVYVGRWTCADKRCAFWVELLDEAGNVVLAAGSPQALLEACDDVAMPPPPAAPAPAVSVEERPPVYACPGLYLAALAVIAAGTGAVFSVRFAETDRLLVAANSMRSEWTLSEAQAVDSARQVNRGVLIGAFAVAAIAAALALWWW